MSDARDLRTNSARVALLVERFHTIGETVMRDLPLFNASLEVEAIGFRLFENGWIGILITPWFMNLIRLPEQSMPMDMARIGQKTRIILPTGEREAVLGGDEVLGTYEALSLHSPMFAFSSQEQAKQEAQRCLEILLQSAEDPSSAETGLLRVDPPKANRRAFLSGGRSKA